MGPPARRAALQGSAVQRPLCLSTLPAPAPGKGATPGPGLPCGRHAAHSAPAQRYVCLGPGPRTRVSAHAHPSAPLTASVRPLQRHLGACGDPNADGGHTWAPATDPRILGGGERRRSPRGQPPRRGDVVTTKLGLCHVMGYSDPGTRTGWDTHVVGGRASTLGGWSRRGREDTGDTHGPYSDRSRAPSRDPHPVPFSLTSGRLSCCCRCPQPKARPRVPSRPQTGKPPLLRASAGLYLSQGA